MKTSGPKQLIAGLIDARFSNLSLLLVAQVCGRVPSLLLLMLVVFGPAPASPAKTASVAAPPVERITVGHSTAPLYGPWKFHLGDSPLNPVTHAPLWAERDFDDSQWETVDLTPPDKSLDPIYGV